MREILELAEQAGVTLPLARVKSAVPDVLAREDVLDRTGKDRAAAAQVAAEEAAVHVPDDTSWG